MNITTYASPARTTAACSSLRPRSADRTPRWIARANRNSIATNPKNPVFSQIHSTELCGRYSQNSKKLMSGIGTGVRNFCPKPTPSSGLLRIVNHRLNASICR